MDSDDGPVSAETEPVLEDFSVYVAPGSALQAPADDEEPLARLEPTFAIVAWPILMLGLAAFLLYASLRVRTRYVSAETARIFGASAIGLLGLLAALPSFIAGSYYAELYRDRIVVRRGKQEWAAPLEEIASIEPMSGGAGGEPGVWFVELIDTLSRSRDPLGSGRSAATTYVVVTTFDSTFSLPPFPGAEGFAIQVYQQRAARLKMRPPMVAQTEREDPEPPLGA